MARHEERSATGADVTRLVPEGSATNILGADSSSPLMLYLTKLVYVTNISFVGTDGGSGSSLSIHTESQNTELKDAGAWLHAWAESNPLMYWSTALVIVVTGGCLTLNIEGRNVPFLAGMACVLGKSVGYRFTVETDYTAFCASISDELYEDVFGGGLTAFVSGGAYDIDVRAAAAVLSLPDFEGYVDFTPRSLMQEDGLVAQTAIAGVVDALRRRSYSMEHEVRYLMRVIVEDLVLSGRYDIQHIRHDAQMGRLIFNRIDRVIQTHDGMVRRRDLAQLFNYSGTYIGMLVKRYTGMSLYDYCMTFTMRAAARRLAETDESVGAITESLGFSDRTHFNRLFKRAYGMTPSAYRKAARD